MTGSANLTGKAFTGNYEHILIMDGRGIVAQHVREFDRFWNDPALIDLESSLPYKLYKTTLKYERKTQESENYPKKKSG